MIPCVELTPSREIPRSVPRDRVGGIMMLMRRTVALSVFLMLLAAAPALAAVWISSPLPEAGAGPSDRGYGSKHVHCAECGGINDY